MFPHLISDMQPKNIIHTIHLSELPDMGFINIINAFQIISNIMDFLLFEELKSVKFNSLTELNQLIKNKNNLTGFLNLKDAVIEIQNLVDELNHNLQMRLGNQKMSWLKIYSEA